MFGIERQGAGELFILPRRAGKASYEEGDHPSSLQRVMGIEQTERRHWKGE